MNIFREELGGEVPKYKRYRIAISEQLLNQFLSKDTVGYYRPMIVEFIVNSNFDEKDDSSEKLLLSTVNEKIGKELRNLVSNEYIQNIFLPIVQKSFITSDEKVLKDLLKDIKSKRYIKKYCND